jgi:hypothetical protein
MEKITSTLQGLFLYALSLLFGFSPIHAEHSKPPLIATGYYFDGHIRRPLLIESLDLGQSWQYPASIHQKPVPNDFLDGGLSKYTCNNFVCIATGNYYNSEENHVPLLLQSTDLGLSWTFQSIKNRAADFQKGWFNDSLCKDTGCFAVGVYENSQGSRPLLALSDPKGIWHYSAARTDNELPSDLSEGWFNTISCSNSGCIAAGTYLDTQVQRHPLIMVSQNDGLTWKPAAYKDRAMDSTDHPDTHLYASTCDSNHCVAVGEYTDPKTSVTPLLMQSTNSGTTWIRPSIPLPPDFLAGWFNAVDCKASFCIAVGTYKNGEIDKPLLIFSADKGAHWRIQEPAWDSELGTHLEYGIYMSASCDEIGCIAGGSFSNYFNTYPLITVSHDKGSSWSYPPSARTSVPAAEHGNGFFGKVRCLQKTCIAAGDYTINSEYFPLLALSKDGGITWNFPESINDHTILPANFINGHF